MSDVRFAWPRRSQLSLAMISLSTLPMLGCAAIMANQVKAEKTEERSFAVSATPAVTVETFNGDIEVSTTPGNKVEAIVTRTGSGANKEAAEADLDYVKVDYSQEGDTVKIIAKRTRPKTFGSSGAEVELKVPAHTSLALSTQNGAITTRAVESEITAHSSNGQIEVIGSKGTLDLETSNGEIKIEADGAIVEAVTTNGNVLFSGTLAKGSHSLETSNGSIEVKLAATAHLHFDARTSNGSVTSRLPELKPKSGKVGSNRLTGLVGSDPAPDVDLKLETSNGNISIEPVPLAEAPKP
jgi:DUF4097 and DUF4098 domain-containing protein YvlB